MKTTFATKVSKNKFSFHLVGFSQNVQYERANGNIILTDEENTPITVLGTEENLDFETFVMIGQNLLLDIIDMSN